MPFGRVGSGEFGTYFIGYARTPVVLEQMLTNMFIGNPPGNYDRILDFSTATTGGLFFVPTVEFLDDPAAQAGAARSTDADLPVREIDGQIDEGIAGNRQSELGKHLAIGSQTEQAPRNRVLTRNHSQPWTQGDPMAPDRVVRR